MTPEGTPGATRVSLKEGWYKLRIFVQKFIREPKYHHSHALGASV